MKAALVTGATSGVGRAIAEALAASGRRVLAVGRDQSLWPGNAHRCRQEGELRMKGLVAVIVGGGAGLGALLAEMMVEEGAAGIGIIDMNVEAAEAALVPARKKGLAVAATKADIAKGPEAHAALDAVPLVGSAARMPWHRVLRRPGIPARSRRSRLRHGHDPARLALQFTQYSFTYDCRAKALSAERTPA